MRSPISIDFPLSVREFAIASELPLVEIHRQVLTDQADLMRLVLAFPEHRFVTGAVTTALRKLEATEQAHEAWAILVEKSIVADSDDDY